MGSRSKRGGDGVELRGAISIIDDDVCIIDLQRHESMIRTVLRDMIVWATIGHYTFYHCRRIGVDI